MKQDQTWPSPTLRVWDAPTRIFHWLLAGSVAVAFLSAEEESALSVWHQAAGWVAAVLIVFRLAWGFVGGEHARFADFLRPSRIGGHVRALVRGRPEPALGHNPLGGLAVLALLTLVGLTVGAGAAMLLGGEDELHEAFAYGLLAMVALHVVAVVAMSFAGGESLVRAMVTGRKPAARHPAGRDARKAPALALPAAAIATAVAVFGVTRIDPQAFGPHPRTEAGEREAHEAGGGAAAPGETRGAEAQEREG